MKKLFILLALVAAPAMAAEKISDVEPQSGVPEQYQAADPFEKYPEAYKDNEHGKAANAPRENKWRDVEKPSETFARDRRGRIIFKN